MLRIILGGYDGQMGRVIKEVLDPDKYQIVAGISLEKGNEEVPVYENPKEIKEEADLIIDFSAPSALEGILAYGLDKKIPLVLAATGYTDEDYEKIRKASNQIPILSSGNMSLGVNVMEAIAEKMAAMLEGFDIEIVEIHHRYKKDSPSGTAKMLFEAVNKGRDESLEELDGRRGFYDQRPPSEVGISAIRGGNIVGDHTIIFAGQDEVLELTHKASSKKIFALGALKAGNFIVDQGPGLYSMKDVL